MAADKVAVVTGGTYGIGRGITLELASQGYRVVAFGLDARQVGSAAENGRAVVPTGVRTGMNESQVARMEQAARDSVAGRNVLPGDIAHVVAVPLSDEAEMITGGVFNVGEFAWQGGPVRRRPRSGTGQSDG